MTDPRTDPCADTVPGSGTAVPVEGRIRRRLLRGLALAPLGALPGIAPGASAKANAHGPLVLELHSSWPSGLPVFGAGVRLFADTVHRMTGGAVRVDVVPSEVHGRALDGFEGVRSGEYDIAHTASYYHVDEEPDALFLSTMPFGMTAPELAAFLAHGGGMTLVNEVYARHGIEAVPGGNTGMQMGGWFRDRVDSVGDLRDLRMRVPGAGGRIMAKLGVETVTLPAESLYDALVSGRLDAVEFVGPSIDLGLGLHRIAPYYYTGWQEPALETFFLFDSDRLAAMPTPLADVLRVAAEHAGSRITSGFQHANAESWASVKHDYPDIRVMGFPLEVVDALRIAREELVDEERARSEFAGRSLDAMDAYIRIARRWTEIGDWSYLADATR